MPKRARVRFDRPPVVEVVCGVLFSTPKPLRGAHIGVYWQSVQKDFPRVEEVVPIAPTIERPDPFMPPEFELTPLPPLRRTWLLSEDGRNLIQVQGDRFLFNWKKADEGDPYPGYDIVIERFNLHLAGFIKFLRRVKIGVPAYRQFELTYVNHIDRTHGLEAVTEGEVLVDHRRRSARGRFLPEPEGYNWVSVYPLPDKTGRLHVVAQTARSQTGERLMRLDLTARGLPTDASESGRISWFDMAHEWITQGFADATLPELHPIWGRTE